MFTSLLNRWAHLGALFLIILALPNCMHCFRVSPERAINQALDIIQDVHFQFGAAFEIMHAPLAGKNEAELQGHVIMTMQEIGQRSKNFLDRWLDVEYDCELFPFVHYQKLIDAYVDRLVSVQKNLISYKYCDSMARRMHSRIAALDDDLSDLIYQLKAVRKFVVSHERYWQEKEKLEKREYERRELMLKKERNEIEKEKLYLERQKLKSKKEKHKNQTNYNLYDVTVVEYYE